jgi:hypothetical protein
MESDMNLEGHIRHHEPIELPVVYARCPPILRKMIREEYAKRQGNRCYYCGGNLNIDPPDEVTMKPVAWRKFPRHFLSHKVHLHHCHKTGLTLGAVHAYCNAVLWHYHGE